MASDTTDIDATRDARAEAAGPAAALDALVRRARPRVFRWALVKTGDADEAEDVAQEVSVRLASRTADASGSAFWPWLYRVTMNVLIDRQRKRKRLVPAGEQLAKLPAATRSALDALVGAETREVLRSFMERLSPRQREMLQLVDVDGYAAAEAADLLGIDAATARVHLLRGRRALRTALMEVRDEL